MDLYVELAKTIVETQVKTGQAPPLAKGLPQEMLQKKAGTFVSIHRKDGSLRGCIGTFLPTQANIAQEIMTNAIAAAHDPRFLAISEEELTDLVYSVDLLSEPKPAKKEELDPKKYGLLVMAPDGRKGLLLPDLPDVETAEEQIAICKRKAGILPDEEVKYQIFTVERHAKHHG